jgi:type II secretory ATPase GspE/PulE/Tfp pilus assembly ATPase PilB-like protein
MSGNGVSALGEIVLRKGLITRSQLDDALSEQSGSRERIGEILRRRNLVSESDILHALGEQLGLRQFDPAHDAIEAPALELIPLEFARRHEILPVRADEKTLTVAMLDPRNVEALDRLRRIAGRSGRSLEILLASSDVIERARENSYGSVQGTRHVTELIEQVVGELGETAVVDEEPDEGEAQRRAQDASIVNLVDRIVAQALQERATDIHIEPLEKGLLIRYRVDGMLHDALTPPRAVYTGTISRIKILANMDIAERRTAQDGRFTYKTNGRDVDVRASAIPTIHGEKLVLRLLDKSNFNFSLRDLGFSEDDYRAFLTAIHQPYGMVLLSGPTGSGKTTTLYASLLERRSEIINIITVEDPVEYQIAGINQVQVNERKNVTFANALRSFLRQDPDVIMVGEIRDRDTAEIAIRAALTGHMVFSTIHANDAPATATRLVSMGAEPFMTASSLTLVAAQRLVRRNCRHCLEEYTPPEEVFLALREPDLDREGRKGVRFVRGSGCAACKGRGYSGRVAIVERMVLTPGLRELIAENRPATEIRRLALAEGMVTLRQSGVQKARDGITTVEDVMRVCVRDE